MMCAMIRRQPSSFMNTRAIVVKKISLIVGTGAVMIIERLSPPTWSTTVMVEKSFRIVMRTVPGLREFTMMNYPFAFRMCWAVRATVALIKIVFEKFEYPIVAVDDVIRIPRSREVGRVPFLVDCDVNVPIQVDVILPSAKG